MNASPATFSLRALLLVTTGVAFWLGIARAFPDLALYAMFMLMAVALLVAIAYVPVYLIRGISDLAEAIRQRRTLSNRPGRQPDTKSRFQ